MKTSIALVLVVGISVLAGCAAPGTEYTKIYDRKYNEVRLVQKQDPGAFVGTSAVKTPARPAGQHP